MAQETELKLALSPEQTLHLRHSVFLRGFKPRRQLLESVYYDTPDFDLFRQGVALRVRRVGRRWIQTVKAEAASLGALSSRPEWEVRVTSVQPEIGRLPELVQAYFPDRVVAGLVPCFNTRFERISWQLDMSDSRLELALDRGEIRAGHRRLALCEVEIELMSGQPASLFDLAEQLAEVVAFQLEPRSKAERGYALAGAFEPVPVKLRPARIIMEQPPGEVWQAMAAAAVAQLSANVPGVRASDDVEYVHQARVAIRRLLVASWLAKTIGLRRPKWRRSVGRLMDRLAPAREWDVFVTELLPSLQSISPAVRDELLKLATQAQHKARAKAREAMASPDFIALMLIIGRNLVVPCEAVGTTRRWANAALDRQLKRLKQLGKNVDQLDAKGRHRLRIAAKKLRYVADAFAPLYGPHVVDFIGRLCVLQDKLGAANDSVMAQQLFAELKLKRQQAETVRIEFERALQEQVTVREQGIAESWQGLLATPPFWRKPKKPRLA